MSREDKEKTLSAIMPHLLEGMNELQYIKHKQKIWEENNNIVLIGSQNNRSEKIYTTFLFDFV
jgi:hypothetical protein